MVIFSGRPSCFTWDCISTRITSIGWFQQDKAPPRVDARIFWKGVNGDLSSPLAVLIVSSTNLDIPNLLPQFVLCLSATAFTPFVYPNCFMNQAYLVDSPDTFSCKDFTCNLKWRSISRWILLSCNLNSLHEGTKSHSSASNQPTCPIIFLLRLCNSTTHSSHDTRRSRREMQVIFKHMLQFRRSKQQHRAFRSCLNPSPIFTLKWVECTME